MLVVESRRQLPIVWFAIQFLFRGLTSFIVENVLSHTYVLANIEWILVRNLSVWEIYLC